MAKREGDVEDAAAVADALRALPVKARNRVLFDLLQEAGATGLVIPGDNGEIEGFLADRTVALKYLKNKSWTIETVWLMKAVFAAQGVGSWIDLGANIGTTVIPAALAGATCHAVEADPDNFALLKRNVERNGVASSVTVHEAAVWDSSKILSFEKAPSNLGDHRVRAADTGKELNAGPADDNAYREAGRETINVRSQTVDRLIKANALPGPVIVKLDVQGAEGHAFSGGTSLFKRADVALLEYWPYGLRRLGTTPEQFLKQVQKYFDFASTISDDQSPQTITLQPVDSLQAQLHKAEQVNPTMAKDLVLSKSGVAIW